MTADRSPERLARAGLCRVVEQGDADAHRMFAGLTVSEAWDRLRSGDVRMGRWLEGMEQADPQRDLDHAAALGIRFVIPGDDEWPIQLGDLATAGEFGRRGGTPYGLWVRGEASVQQVLARSVTVVGARACSSYGAHLTSNLAGGLAENGLTVVSGGAYGIDAAAHRGALADGGVTVGFLASGVDNDYPRGHAALFDRIAENGVLVSERPPGSVPTKIRFFARNRLLAASTLGTVVTEAARRSGSLNTAAWAEACRRPVFAVPGPVTSAMSAGTNQLIRERKADLVTDVDHILEVVSPDDELPVAAEHDAVPHAERHAEQPIERAGRLGGSLDASADRDSRLTMRGTAPAAQTAQSAQSARSGQIDEPGLGL